MNLNDVLVGRTTTKIEISEHELELTLDNGTKLEVTSHFDHNKFMSVLDVRVYTKPEVYIEFGHRATTT